MGIELESVRGLVVAQNESRKLWRENSSSAFISSYAREEFGELERALYPIDPELDRWEVASELGDVEYLSIRLEQVLKETGEPFPNDVMFFRGLAWQRASQLGIDMAKAVHMKVIRNDLKYPASLFNDGISYEEARSVSKKLWEEMGGDKKFYRWYETVFGTI